MNKKLESYPNLRKILAKLFSMYKIINSKKEAANLKNLRKESIMSIMNWIECGKKICILHQEFVKSYSIKETIMREKKVMNYMKKY